MATSFEGRVTAPVAPVSVEEHLDRALAQIAPLPPRPHPLAELAGLVLAEDVHASITLPRWDNSAMDGYAVARADLAGADQRPVRLPVAGEIAAGLGGARTLARGTALRIMTGAPVPAGATAVVPVVWTSERGGAVEISRAPAEGQHIRRAGEDVRAGDLLVRAGTRLTPRHVGLLAAVGLAEAPAYPRPRVVLMSTGSELVEPGRPLGEDSIHDSNSPQLAAAAQAHGALATRATASSDDPEAFAAALADAVRRADLVVTSGGVSMGTRDVVKEVLSGLGTVTFSAVAMQPGKPQGFGLVEGTPIFTLPGNPVSSYVSFEVFVVPALRRLAGRADDRRQLLAATLTEPLTSMAGRRQFARAWLERTSGGARVRPVGGAGSHLLGGLAQANALLVVAEDDVELSVGDQVQVLDLEEDR